MDLAVVRALYERAYESPVEPPTRSRQYQAQRGERLKTLFGSDIPRPGVHRGGEYRFRKLDLQVALRRQFKDFQEETCLVQRDYSLYMDGR